MQQIILAVKQRLKEILGDFGELDLAAEGIVADSLLAVVAEIKGESLSKEEEKAFTPEDWASYFKIDSIEPQEYQDRLFARIAAEVDKLIEAVKGSLDPMESRVFELQVNKVKNQAIISQLKAGGGAAQSGQSGLGGGRKDPGIDLKVIAGEA